MAPVRRSDLDALAARHAQDEAEEASRDLVDSRRPLSVRRPPAGKLVQSEAWLARLYRGPKEHAFWRSRFLSNLDRRSSPPGRLRA